MEFRWIPVKWDLAEGPANLFIPVLSIPVEFRWILEFIPECSPEWSSLEWVGTAFRWNGLFVCYLFVMDNKQCLFGSRTRLLFSLPPPSRHTTTNDDRPHCGWRQPQTMMPTNTNGHKQPQRPRNNECTTNDNHAPRPVHTHRPLPTAATAHHHHQPVTTTTTTAHKRPQATMRAPRLTPPRHQHQQQRAPTTSPPTATNSTTAHKRPPPSTTCTP